MIGKDLADQRDPQRHSAVEVWRSLDNRGALDSLEWVGGPMLREVEKYLESVKKYPNPPARNITRF